MYFPYQIIAHLLLLLLPCLLLLSATPSPAPDPYPAVVSLPARPQSPNGQLPLAKVPSPDVDHDLLPFVIISTIDGALHAVERDGGNVRWTLRDGVSPLVGGEMRGTGSDEYIVEPLSGALFEFEGTDTRSVRKLPLTVEQLIELSPFTFPHSPSRIFTGSKHTSLLTIDLRTGQQIDCFSSVNISNAVCENAQLLDDMEGRSRKDADILFVGRTDYRLTIHTPSTALYSTSAPGLGESVTDDKRSGFQEITYSTYTPNSFDKPLAEFWAKAGSNQRMWEEDGTEAKSTRIVIGHDGVIVGVENGGGVKWVKALGSVGIGVYDVLLPLSPLTAKPIIIPQPPPDLESLLPLPSNPDQQHFDIRAKSPSTYIGSVPLQLALPGPDGAPTRAPEKPILYALSSHSYPLINFVPTAQPGQLVNSSFPLSEDTPDKDRLLPYMIDPAAEEKTIDPAPETLLDGLQRRTGRAGRWIFWVIGVLAALVLAGFGVAGLIGRKTIKQTATPPNEKEPLLVLTESEKPRISFADDTAGESSSITKPVHSAEVKEDDKPKKKNGRRRVRGKKKRSDSHAPKDGGDDDDDDRSSVASPVKGDKPLPDLPRAMSSTALEDDNDKERLAISDNVIGYGSHGTVVLKGTWGGRPVAVKRLLSDFTLLASQEVKLLKQSDDHPNVIRYYCQERRENFLYIALDLCQASLADLIESPDQHRELASSLDRKKALVQVTSGLKHLHGMKIIHRDIKPQNVLVTRSNDGNLKMVVSDFGLARRLEQDQSSFAPTANNLAGSLGWRAPECIRGQVKLNQDFDRESTMSSSSSSGSLLDLAEKDAEDREVKRSHARLTKAVDLFALGCLYFWVLMSGRHPYGETYNRESNIVKGDAVNMGELEILGEEGVEAQDLISNLLSLNPADRPGTSDCLTHPFFWTPAKRLAFLCEASDRFEIMQHDPPEPTIQALETSAAEVVGKDWCSKLDKTFTSSLGKYRKYKGNSVRDLLRAMRNKKNHYQDLEPAAKRHLGALPTGFLLYFTTRYPRLFLHVYGVIKGSLLEKESVFVPYFSGQE